MGAFMVGAAVGSAQCFYWLYEDVKQVGCAMNRKIESVRLEVRAITISKSHMFAKIAHP